MKRIYIAVAMLSATLCFPHTNVDAANVDLSASRVIIPHGHVAVYNMATASDTQFATEVLQLVNTERRKVGVRPLRMSTDLMQATAIRARELTERFSHTRPDGSDCFSVLRDRNRHLGENIAAGQSSPASVVDSWMHSSGHRANILNARFSEIGIGYCYDGNSEYGHYWVQMFRG